MAIIGFLLELRDTSWPFRTYSLYRVDSCPDLAFRDRFCHRTLSIHTGFTSSRWMKSQCRSNSLKLLELVNLIELSLTCDKHQLNSSRSFQENNDNGFFEQVYSSGPLFFCQILVTFSKHFWHFKYRKRVGSYKIIEMQSYHNY